MKTFSEALIAGKFQSQKASYHFDWKDGENKYELWFEKLLGYNQYYVAIYKNQEILTERVVIKPGYQKNDNEITKAEEDFNNST